MAVITAAFQHDANHQPITQLGLTTLSTKTLSANNTTASVPIFTLTGQVLVNAIWGVVTTVLGANNTAAYWRLNDQTAQSDITLATGTTLSALPVGSMIVKKGLAAAALAALSASQERVSEPTTLETMYFSPFAIMQKTGGITTDIEFTYTTTDTPTSGGINFFVAWVPITPGSQLTAK